MNLSARAGVRIRMDLLKRVSFFGGGQLSATSRTDCMITIEMLVMML